MISQEYKQLLNEMKLTNYGKALQALLDEKYAEINDVRHCTSWDDTLARAKAIKILDDIFYFMKDTINVQSKNKYD